VNFSVEENPFRKYIPTRRIFLRRSFLAIFFNLFSFLIRCADVVSGEELSDEQNFDEERSLRRNIFPSEEFFWQKNIGKGEMFLAKYFRRRIFCLETSIVEKKLMR
jgi:hypothetical protein